MKGKIPEREKERKEKRVLLTGNGAAAWGARLAKAESIPNFPVTPQTEIIETIAKWVADGKYNPDFMMAESEHSVMSAAVGSQSAGVRTFTATSSQGLLLMHEILYVASGMRLPIVMVNVSRGLSAPITLWSDFNDILDQRDSGWLIFFAQDNQEVLDTVIQAYKVAENRHVMLPAIVNMEGFIHSYTREPVSLPGQRKVDAFLPRYKPLFSLDPKKPMTLGLGVMEQYTYFRNQVHLAQKNALKVIEEVQKDWAEKFGRNYGLVETFMADDCDVCLVTAGSISTTARHVVSEMRKKGIKAGLARIRVFRPWPEHEIKRIFRDIPAIAVIDKDISPGYGGIFYNELKATLYGEKEKTINDFIMGLGGQHIRVSDLEYAIEQTIFDACNGQNRIEWVGIKRGFGL